MGRHLICLIDGTWVSADTSVLNQTYSNVYKLGMLLANYSGSKDDPEENIVFYSRGLGAQRTLLTRYTAGGFAAGLEEEIADVYINLASNYLPGDKIYFFGFSRGAVIARAVAGLIGSVGLLKDRYIGLYKEVWEQYRRDKPHGLPEDRFSAAGEVEFLGVFDTVYGGTQSKEKLLDRLGFQNDCLSGNIKHAVHLLSLDDRRIFFRPILWAAGIEDRAEQIWMPGVHSNVGGTPIDRFLGDVSLLAMVDRIRAKTGLGLYFKEVKDIYDDVVNNLKLPQQNVIVSYELDFWLWRLQRKEPRVRAEGHISQWLHPIVDPLKKSKINYWRKAMRQYDLHPTFEKLPRFQFPFYPIP